MHCLHTHAGIFLKHRRFSASLAFRAILLNLSRNPFIFFVPFITTATDYPISQHREKIFSHITSSLQFRKSITIDWKNSPNHA